MDTGFGRKGGGINWEIGIDMYTPLWELSGCETADS